ncbi:dipeptidyl aminopeptidase/acylaminoacyl peptidase [Paraburkholderia caballeronis]|uniref:DPP IV N-terminal domain-containing protein n=1 Tax=Paraburkholderia caballeronis TaxID=416943 RepID=UPI0010663EC8|nr:DPP IV N-terminal domain-containing protein [Paraburkholderia caballeronis]TDV33831.1 dipeptidyl aminopeptidase/acylaminoacyl peptidase [Paraburkholderia caballeronis]
MPNEPLDARPEWQGFADFLEIGSLVKGGRVAVNWLPDGRLWFAEGAPENTVIKVLDPGSGALEDLFDVARVRTALASVLGRQVPYAGLPFEAFRLAGPNALFTFDGVGYRLDTANYTVEAQPAPNQMEQLFGRSPAALASPRTFVRPSYHAETFAVPEMPSPDGSRMVGIVDFDLALHYASDGRVEKLTDDGEQYYGWDVESVRMGMIAGGSIVERTTSPWSPDGLKIFATKFDQRRVPIQTRTHLLKRYDDVEEVRVARTGDPIPVVEPYLVDVLQRKAIRIDVPTEDCLLLFLGWQADGRSLYFVLYSRDMHEAALYVADARTGDARLVHRERAKSYIRIQHQIVWGRAGCTLIADGTGFLWESEADGWNHLYHYDMQGRLQRQLTSGEFPVLDVLGVDRTAGYVYFTAHHDQSRPYDVHFCRVPLAGGEIERLTPEAGVHEIQLAPDFSSFVATRSMPDLPPRSEVRRHDGTLVHAFPAADISRLHALGWTPPEQFSVKAADGVTDLWGVIFKPPHFDPAKRYSVIEGIYGGPQIVNTPHNFHAPVRSPFYALHCALPQLGYVVVVLDARGTPERSKAFQDTSYKEWRRHVGNDHAGALKAIGASRPWMDMTRVGIWGHSWGGYHTFACMIDHPDVYCAGVASAPGFDPYDYFIHEPYFGGVPDADNITAYQDASLFGDAAKLKGDLMLVAGTSDICPWRNATKMTDALLKAGIDHEFVMLPDEVHGYGAKQEAYFIKKLAGHFDRYLKGANR